jgi:hypothetical protein
VIGAHDRAIDDPALGELGATMDAEILPKANLAFVPPGHEIFAEEADRYELALPDIPGEGDDMPIVDERQIRLRWYELVGNTTMDLVQQDTPPLPDRGIGSAD